MAVSHIELDRNPVLSTTTDRVTNDGKPVHVLDVNAVVNLGDVTVSASQAEGPTGDPVPDHAIFIGFEDDTGDLVGVSAANPLPITGIGLATSANQTTQISSLAAIDTNTSGLTRAEDSASVSGDKGVGILCVRTNTPANLSSAEFDYEFPQMSAGRVWVSAKIDTALPAGSNVLGHVIVDSGNITVSGNISASNPSVGDTADPTPTAATLIGWNNGGILDDVTVSTPLPVSVPGLVTADVSGSTVEIISSAQHPEDFASASGDDGFGMLAVRSDTPANLSNANLDYEFLQMSAGRVWVSSKIDTALPAGSNVIGHVIVDSGAIVVTGNLTNISGTISLPTGASTAAKQPALGTAGAASADVITVQGIASMTPILATVTGNITTVTTVTTLTTITNDVKVIGDTAADAALTVSPVTVGARATNANPTNMSAAGDVVNLQADLGGRLVTIEAPRELVHRTNTSLSNTTTETTIIAATASTFHDLYGLILANTGAAASEVTIRDDTAGGTLMTFYVPVGDTRGFMVPIAAATPQGAVNKNWTATCATATTAMKITALYVDRI